MPDIMDYAKTFISKQRVDSWEIFLTTSQSFRVEVKGSVVDSLQRSNLKGMAVRVIKDYRPGFSFSSSSEIQNIEKTIIDALDIATVMPRDDSASFTKPYSDYELKPGLLKDHLLVMPERDKIEIARIIENEAYAFDKRISIARTSGYVDSITHVRMANSFGLDISGQSGICSAWVELMAEESGEQETSYWYDQNRDPLGIDPRQIARKAARRAIGALGGVPIKSDRMPVILENTTAAGFLGVISNSFVAENHFKKTASPLITRGARLFSEKLGIIDDGMDERGELAFGFDGEGAPAQKTVVVEGGEVRSWLYDRYYGAKFSQPSTGNSRRAGFESPPTSGITNFFIEPGKLTLDQMMKVMSNGLLITEVMGLHTANPVSGDFSVGASGFRISNGTIEHPVRGIAIAGNVIDLFGKLIEVGNDFQYFGNIGACSLLCEPVSVSGS
jgi:PmbA protein